MLMTSIDWNDEFKLGLPAMDSDHQELLELTNQFLATAQEQGSLSSVLNILDRLILRTRAHFLAEERLLDRHGYPGLAIHKSEHERLLSQLDTLRGRFGEADQADQTHGLTLEAAEFLQNWLLDHIKVNDKPYRPFLMSLV